MRGFNDFNDCGVGKKVVSLGGGGGFNDDEGGDDREGG